jgi:ankyrin repeat protein
MPFRRFLLRSLFAVALGCSIGPVLPPGSADALTLLPPKMRGEGVCGDLERGDFAAVDRAVREGLNLDAPDPKDISRRPPLICSAEEGWPGAVRYLLDRKANVEVEGAGLMGRRTALVCAASEGHEEIVRMLLAAGANVNARDVSGRTALMWAAYEGDKRKSEAFAAIVEALLGRGADRNAKDRSGDTALALAIGNRNPTAVAMLSSGGADVNLRDKEGRTPLMLAADEGDADMVEALLAARARVEEADRSGKTAWVYAAEKAHRPVMDRLRKAGAVERYKAVDPEETFRNAACEGDVPLMERMTKRGMTCRSRKKLCEDAIVLAASRGRLDPVRFLLDGGTPAGNGGEDGRTPLMAAMEDYSGTGAEAGNRTEIARLLIARGADVNARDAQGETALVRAIGWNNPGAVRLLLSKGADPDTPDSKGAPPLTLAARKGNVEMTRALLEARAKTDARDREGKTAITLAVEGSHREVTALLADAGASPDYASMGWEGKESAVEEPLEAAVTDRGEWDRLWRRAFGKDAPDVDFGRFFVACVFLGHRAGWWYSIGFEGPVVRGEEDVVGYGLMMLQMRLSPEGSRNPGFPGQYAMKVFPKRDGKKPVVKLVDKERGGGPKRGGDPWGEPSFPPPGGEFR